MVSLHAIKLQTRVLPAVGAVQIYDELAAEVLPLAAPRTHSPLPLRGLMMTSWAMLVTFQSFTFTFTFWKGCCFNSP